MTSCDRPHLREERGFTIVELIVAMAVTSVVLAIVTTGAVSLLRAINHIDVRTENVDNARLAVATLSRDLRAAVPPVSGEPTFLVAEPRHARFTAHLGDSAVPVLIDLRVEDDGRLVERETAPSVDPTTGEVTYLTEDERVRYVASYVFNGAGEPVLSYGEPSATDVTWFGPDLSEHERRRIRLVRIDLSVSRDQERRAAAQRVTTVVRVPNHRGAL